jgi:hypothetical protein
LNIQNVVASDVMNMFFISDIKSHLSHVFQWTILAFHLVNATSAVLVCLCMCSVCGRLFLFACPEKVL